MIKLLILIKSELLKLKKISFIVSLLTVPLLAVVFGCINYYMNTSILQKEWLSLWGQEYMIYGFMFLPVLVGIVVSFVWHSEHKRAAFKLLLTSPIKQGKIVLAKIIAVFVVVLSTQLYFFMLYFISGQLFRFNSPFPSELFLYLIVLTFFLLPLISFQGYVSIMMNSFVLPVGMALVLSLLALIMSAQNKIVFLRYLFATTYLTLSMNHYPDMKITMYEWLSMSVFGIIIFWFFYALQVYVFKRKLK